MTYQFTECDFRKFLQRVKATAEVKKELQRQLAEWIKDDETVKEILIQTQDYMKKNGISEHEVVVMVSCLLTNGENKNFNCAVREGQHR